MLRALDFEDRLVSILDSGLRALLAPPVESVPSPAHALDEPTLTSAERRHSAALMRVNHAGEISAQALYLGQALLARSPETRERLLAAAAEEHDHLAWCAKRLDELGGRRSLLDPFWFAGSAVIGALAAASGDRASLGFVAETERQVEAHLDDHLERLPSHDTKSAAILRRMAADEAQHGTRAIEAGGAPPTAPIRAVMAICGGFLRRISFFL